MCYEAVRNLTLVPLENFRTPTTKVPISNTKKLEEKKNVQPLGRVGNSLFGTFALCSYTQNRSFYKVTMRNSLRWLKRQKSDLLFFMSESLFLTQKNSEFLEKMMSKFLTFFESH